MRFFFPRTLKPSARPETQYDADLHVAPLCQVSRVACDVVVPRFACSQPSARVPSFGLDQSDYASRGVVARSLVLTVPIVLLVVGGFHGWRWIRARPAKASAPQTTELHGGRQGEISAANTMSSPLPISTIRFWSNDDSTNVIIELARQVQFDAHRLTDPERVYFDLQGTRLPDNERERTLNIGVAETLVRKIRVAERQPGVTRVVLETKGACEYSAVVASNPYRFIVQIRPSQ